MTLCHKCYLPFPHNPNSQQQSVVETETMVTTTPPTISTNKNAIALAVPGPASSATLFIRFYDFWKILLYFLINCVILFDVLVLWYWFRCLSVRLTVCMFVYLSLLRDFSRCRYCTRSLVAVWWILTLSNVQFLFDNIVIYATLFRLTNYTCFERTKVCSLCVWLSL